MAIVSNLLPKSWKFYLFSLVVCTLIILGGTLTPANHDLPPEFWSNDKLVHFFAFFIWTLLLGLFRFFKKDYRLWPIIVWGILFGLFIETLQHYLPIQRSAELYDFIADGLGSIAALVLLSVISTKIKHFNRSLTP